MHLYNAVGALPGGLTAAAAATASRMDGHDAQLSQLAASVLQLQEAVRQAERRQAAAEEAQGLERAALLQQLGTAQETISSQARCARVCRVGYRNQVRV